MACGFEDDRLTMKANAPLPILPDFSRIVDGLQKVVLALNNLSQTIGVSYVSSAGANVFTGSNTFQRPIDLPTFTVATLPAAVKGMRAFVSDSTQTLAAGIGTLVVGAGADFVPVYGDAAPAWRIG